jgi:hypothetical protein
VPPFDLESARRKVQAAEDAWNTRDPPRVLGAYSVDSMWRNRGEVLQGHGEIIEFLRRDPQPVAEPAVVEAAREQGISVASGMISRQDGVGVDGSAERHVGGARGHAIASRESMPALNSRSADRSAESAVGDVQRIREKSSSTPVAAASAWASSRLRFDPNRWVNAGAESPTRSATAARVSPAGPASVTTAVTAAKIASSLTVRGLPVRMELTVADDFMNVK